MVATAALVRVLTFGDRTTVVQRIVAPTLVLHGREDPLLPVQCAIETAAQIRGATLSVIDGMGHDLPTALQARLAEQIVAHCRAHHRVL